MKHLLFLTLALSLSLNGFAQNGYKIGDKVEDFTLLNAVNNANVSLSSLSANKAVVVVFTSHNCPYTKIYEQRAKTFIEEYAQKGVSFLLINPNNPETNPEESKAEMAASAKEKGYNSPYLADPKQAVANKFGASKTPEIFVLKSQSGSFILKYKGAIDDNPQVSSEVNTSYLRAALDAVINNQPVKITEKRATGCMIHR